MRSSAVLAAWQYPDDGLLAGSLSDDIVFSSPVADYEGRAKAGHLLTLIPETLGQRALTGQWADELRLVTTFTATVSSRRIDGVLIEEQNEGGQLTHVTLFLRPLKSLRAAIEHIQQLLAHDPLPEA